jgi:hypothetical protein
MSVKRLCFRAGVPLAHVVRLEREGQYFVAQFYKGQNHKADEPTPKVGTQAAARS